MDITQALRSDYTNQSIHEWTYDGSFGHNRKIQGLSIKFIGYGGGKLN